jgi:hypothetical protein
MSTPANVQSSDAIDAVRLALISFAEQVSDALTELSTEMRRVLEWLEHDRPRYWKNQVRLSTDEVHQAQQALHRCLMFPIAGERPSCYEERAALKKAQARAAYCQEKTERVRHWQRVLQHELFEYDGRISQLVRILEIDVPRAIAMLERIIRHLDEYQAIRAADPRSSYNDVALAQAIWAEEKPDSTDSAPTSETKGEVESEAALAAGSSTTHDPHTPTVQSGATKPREE